MSSLVSLSIELDAIRSFLENVISTVDSEYSKIAVLARTGIFTDIEDESNAYFTPHTWEQIAIRATLGELNALVEWELYNLAIEPFFRKKPHLIKDA